MIRAHAPQAANSQPRKVLVIASLAWSLLNFRMDLMRRMRANGHHVIAAAPDMDTATETALKAHGITPVTVPMQRTGLNPVDDLRTLRALRRIIRHHRPDVILPYTMKPIVYGCLAARLEGGVPCYPLFTGLGYAFSEPHPKGKRRLVRHAAIRLHRLATRDVSLGFHYNAADLHDLRRFDMVPDTARMISLPSSGIDTTRFAASPLPPGQPVFLFVGRMLRSKGVDDLLRAAQVLRAEGRHFRLELLGPTDSNPDAIDPAGLRRLRAAGEVIYHPMSRDVRPYLSACHVFVLPTKLREGVPRTILEAMATARPVITTDAPGCGETIRDGESGFVVPMGNVEALAGAMRRFLDDPALAARLGARARREVCRSHAVDRVNYLLLTHLGLEPRPLPVPLREAVA
ncbi:MAG: glycosyltransferase family 4 protein [Celeribacter sp.]|jgi:glycosyltransferase involved in cell wall biosynthesis